MASRTTYKSTTPGTLTGDTYLDHVADHFATMYQNLPLPLINVAGTANAITADVEPALDVGLVAGMSFWLTPDMSNTGPVTLAIGAEAAKNVLAADGSALAADDLQADAMYLLQYQGIEYRVVNKDTSSIGASVRRTDVFTTSGTLTKPTGFPDEGLVIIEAWGGGGGGQSNGSNGGGGGGYNRGLFRGLDLGATETVTVGAGGGTGAPASTGGTTSVGSLLSAYGGGGGGPSGVGGGGGQITAGATANVAGRPASSAGSTSGTSGDWGGGAGGSGSGVAGGDSLFGGGGGGSGSGGAGGVSVWGGNGGGGGVGGVIPGGGGGHQAAGARGEVRVRWIA